MDQNLAITATVEYYPGEDFFLPRYGITVSVNAAYRVKHKYTFRDEYRTPGDDYYTAPLADVTACAYTEKRAWKKARKIANKIRENERKRSVTQEV